MDKIDLQTTKRETPIVFPENLIFGRNFTDHIFEMDYNPEKGWHNPVIKKYSTLDMNPASMVLHYGQAVFEGLKAYKQANGKIVLFRPEKNFERLNNSNRRMCIPEFDEKFILESLIELIKIEKNWIPTKPGHSLYIRPFIFANDPFVGVKSSDTFKFLIILSPVGPYYPQGFKPVPIMVTEDYVRAVRKGIGECKAAANYAASLMGQASAKKLGFSQVLWLDGVEQKYIEEVGTMNIFIRFKDEVATPMLNGSILPGITRLSALEILRDWKYNVSERLVSIAEVVEAYNKGELLEIFGTGTAAIISAVSRLKYRDMEIKFDEEEAGELSQKLYAELTGIQFGTKEDKHDWLTFVE